MKRLMPLLLIILLVLPLCGCMSGETGGTTTAAPTTLPPTTTAAPTTAALTTTPAPTYPQNTISLYPNGYDDSAAIHDAIEMIPNGGTILFHPGTYYANITIENTNKSFSLVSLEGKNTTILDGQKKGSVIQVKDIDGYKGISVITVQGFTIRNGSGTYNYYDGEYYYSSNVGGGIMNENSSLILSNCTLTENAAYEGAGVYCKDSYIQINNCFFENNIAATIDNYGRVDEYGYGGGLILIESDATISSCGFRYNEAGQGGGISNNDSKVTILECSFYRNEGSGIMTAGHHDTHIVGCMFNDNVSWYGGGGISNYGSAVLIENCTFSNNSERGEGGGAIINWGATTIITNCKFSMNKAGIGGGVCNMEASNTTFNDCTFYRNTAEYGGGAVYDDGDIVWGPYPSAVTYVYSSCTFNKCIFKENVAYDGDVYWEGGAIYYWKSCIGLNDCVFEGNLPDDLYEDPFVYLGNSWEEWEEWEE